MSGILQSAEKSAEGRNIMKKIVLAVLIVCLTLGGTMSANAAETRSAACADPNCPGFLRTRTTDVSLPDTTMQCFVNSRCTITFKNRVSHLRTTYCSECGEEYKTEELGITQTQDHSMVHPIP